MVLLFEDDFIKFESVNDSGIIVSTLKESVVITLEIAKKIREARISIWGDKFMPIITNVNGLGSIEDAARDYFASAESMKLLSSIAIVTNKKIQVQTMNFFILFSKPAVPTRLFTNFEEALKWSKNFC